MKQIREGKFSKFIAYYLIVNLLIEIIAPTSAYALTSGPTQPEFNSFTPIATSDMVDLASGDFNYNIPIMDVGGYPINLAYNSGVTMDQEASWVGLGWNLNVGQIERQVRGLPDDFRGDEMVYENDLRDNKTIGANFMVHPAFFGNDTPLNVGLGLGVQYNNYEGVSFKPSFGITFELNDNVSIGANFSSSVAEGASVRPSVSISNKIGDKSSGLKLGNSFGVSLNSRKGVENMSVSASVSNNYQKGQKYGKDNSKSVGNSQSHALGGASASLSFNNTSMTPTKRIGFTNSSFTFDGAFGLEVFGVEGQGQITGYGSTQKISPEYKHKVLGAYGYENTHHKMNNEGVMDFNREKEQEISKNTNVLATTNYTYDIYNIQGQGIGGSFRPQRSQVSYVYNDNVTDSGDSNSFGAEFGGASLFHGGVNFNMTPTVSSTGRWTDGNQALPYFTENASEKNKRLDYEPYAYKLVGEMNVDTDSNYYNALLQNKALRLKLAGGNFNRKTTNQFLDHTGITTSFNKKIKRDKRLQRNQAVYRVSKTQALKDPFIKVNDNAKNHHTAGYKVLQPGGATYVYGETVYNTKKVEGTFDVSGQSAIDIEKGIVTYNGNPRTGATLGNNSSDHYKNFIETPAYAHTYLLTSMLSPDYEDIDNNGPTDSDLGTYTKFVYKHVKENDPTKKYKWRVPFESNKATYNEGLKSSKLDEKGNYLYGEKEVKYVKYIETKTHVAYFYTSNRDDAKSSSDEQGGEDTSVHLQQLDKISLYSKAELKARGVTNIANGPTTSCIPIKTAYFEYEPYQRQDGSFHQLCSGAAINGGKGKLTLAKVYFTYKNSNMGKYTPYTFEYAFNPVYNSKGQDIWGNYKETVSGAISNAEFPFVKQDKVQADQYAAAWSLTTIKLPSGGEINLQLESDDYRYVQDKKAQQMFMVTGAGNSGTSIDTNGNLNELYELEYRHKDYLYVKISDQVLSLNHDDAYKKYLEGIPEEVYFRFMLNMTDSEEDYVSGYFNIEKSVDQQPIFNVFNENGKTYLALKVKKVKMGGGIEAGRMVSPIAKSGWSFGRKFLNRIVYSMGGEETNKDFNSIVNDLVGSIAGFKEIYKGPNKVLEEKNCARKFNPNKSWIRLNCPENKLGGGLRVKSLSLSDNWNVMLSTTDNFYNQKYGQEFNYNNEDGTSTGVATFEPNGSQENPFMQPIFNRGEGYENTLGARNFVDGPIGEGFFPSSTVTYAKVTVSQMKNGENISKHGTGKTVTHHYTSRDFPTIVRYTDLEMYQDENKSNPLSLLNIFSVNHITASQGFAIETNDMNGKVKIEEVYPENQTTPISKVEYKYNLDENGKLTNKFTTIDALGNINPETTLGETHDLITDFNESNSQSNTVGMDCNVATFLIGIFPVVIPMPLPKQAEHTNILRTATTTKVTHRTGVMVEKIAYDLGSRVSTKNLAWDAESGDVILTETINEFNDKYYSFNYPAYWMNQPMGLASKNIGIEGYIKRIPECDYDPSPYFKVRAYNDSDIINDITPYFQLGDELSVEVCNENGQLINAGANDLTNPGKVWVVGISPTKKGLLLMNREGNYIDDCGNNNLNYKFTIVRSGYRNLQNSNMASVTTMVNPLLINPTVGAIPTNFKLKIDENLFKYDGIGTNPKIVNASAVLYNDFWKPQNEFGITAYPTSAETSSEEINYPYLIGFNPYLKNVKGEWRAEKSYAYLTGRNASKGAVNNPRHEGFFTKYNSFYQLKDGKWIANNTGWQFASSITQFSPFGNEIENKDALNRYSSAQFGYNHNLPMAVASNSKYSEMGFEGFEETQNDLTKHFMFTKNNSTPEAVELSRSHSHTGNKSVKVINNTSVKLTKKINPKVNVAQLRTCDYDCTNMLNINHAGRNYLPHFTNDENNHYQIPYPFYNEYIIKPSCPGISIYIKPTPDGYGEDGLLLAPYTVTPLSNGEIKIRVYDFITDGPNVIQDQYINIPIFINDLPTNLKYYFPYLSSTCTGCHGQPQTEDFLFSPGVLKCN